MKQSCLIESPSYKVSLSAFKIVRECEHAHAKTTFNLERQAVSDPEEMLAYTGVHHDQLPQLGDSLLFRNT